LTQLEPHGRNRLRGAQALRSRFVRLAESAALQPALPVLCLVVVLGLDAVAGSRSWPVPLAALLDEPAHLMTAWIVLAAAGSQRVRRVAGWALLGAVAIDLDHVLLYLGWWHVAPDGGRPFTHSLATVVVLLATAAAPAVRIPALGLAVGVVLHLFRDLGTGPGVPLWWPLSGHSVTIPYRAYVAVLTLATIVAVAAALRRRRVSGP